LHFFTKANISYLSIYIVVGGNTYNLSPSLSKNIKNLLPSFPYTFKIPVKENQRKINFTFTIINDTTKPFDYVEVNEYYSRSPYKIQISRKIANASPKNNQLDLSFYYLIMMVKKDINYIDVVVTPKKKFQN